ncbi:MAG: CoA-binding protein [PVC group bacterium]
MEKTRKKQELRDLDLLFNARSVAIVGASANPEKLGYEILNNLINMGYEGPIYPINPKADEILGLKAYPSLSAVGRPIDLIGVIVPGKLAPGVIEEAGRLGVKGAVVISGGFREIGNDDLEAALVAAARAGGVGIIGPNCQGINYPANKLCISWPLIKRKGGLALISQSGTIAAALGDRADKEGIGIAGLVALGNRCDIDESDLINFFGNDPSTDVIAVYLEGIRDGEKFMEVGKRVAREKPVLVLKGGRTERGRKAAESHTKSIAGRGEIFDAALRKIGFEKVESIDELYDCAKVLAAEKKRPGKRVQVLTSSGGSGIVAVDVLEELGLDAAPLSAAAKKRLTEVLPSHCVVGNPLDLTGDTPAERYQEAVLALSEVEPGIDLYLLIFGDPIPRATENCLEMKKAVAAPIIACYIGGGEVEEVEFPKMNGSGIPTFPTPDRAARAARSILTG